PSADAPARRDDHTPTKSRSSVASRAGRPPRPSCAWNAGAGCWSPPTACAANARCGERAAPLLNPSLAPEGFHYPAEARDRGLRVLQPRLEDLRLHLLVLQILVHGFQGMDEDVDRFGVLPRMAGKILDRVSDRCIDVAGSGNRPA